jgi:hypothetical protein
MKKEGKKPYLFGKPATAKSMPKGKGGAKGKGKACK